MGQIKNIKLHIVTDIKKTSWTTETTKMNQKRGKDWDRESNPDPICNNFLLLLCYSYSSFFLFYLHWCASFSSSQPFGHFPFFTSHGPTHSTDEPLPVVEEGGYGYAGCPYGGICASTFPSS